MPEHPDLFGPPATPAARGALLSPCGAYRYRLWREWDGGKPAVGWLMLNPSTADANDDDPTMRRVIGFSRAWGYGRCEVANLFALRSSDPKVLRTHPDPVGPDNDWHTVEALGACDRVICGWGAGVPRKAAGRVGHVLGLLDWLNVYCLARTKDGSPQHPLFAPGRLVPVPYRLEGHADDR